MRNHVGWHILLAMRGVNETKELLNTVSFVLVNIK